MFGTLTLATLPVHASTTCKGRAVVGGLDRAGYLDDSDVGTDMVEATDSGVGERRGPRLIGGACLHKALPDERLVRRELRTGRIAVRGQDAVRGDSRVDFVSIAHAQERAKRRHAVPGDDLAATQATEERGRGEDLVGGYGRGSARRCILLDLL